MALTGDATLQRSEQLFVHQVASGVWGLYNLAEATLAFCDQLTVDLIDMIGEEGTFDELLAVCCRVAPSADESELDREIRGRIEKLVAFGAIGHVPKGQAPVLLIDPPCPVRMIGTRGPAKALTYLRAALGRAQMDASIIDLRSVSDAFGAGQEGWCSYFVKYASGLSPHVVGITAVSATIESALRVANIARSMFDDALIVLGGPHASYEWKSVLSSTSVDAVVVGEGEIPFPALVRKVLDEGKFADFSKLEGVAWKDEKGAISYTGWCRGVENLDDLGFPDDLGGVLNAGDFSLRYGRIISARGCPFKCSFCSTASFTGRRVRERSTSSVIEEIRYYRDVHGIKVFSFDDDIFTVKRRRVLAMCEAIQDAGLARDITWGCNTRMDCIDEEILGAMARAGCRHILFGIESGSPDVQERFGKGRRSLRGFQHKMRIMESLGIEPQLNFILGLPGEDKTSVELIWELVRDFPGVATSFNFLNVFPGTPLEAESERLGLVQLGSKPADRYSVTAPTVSSPTLSGSQQIEAYLDLQWRRFRTGALREELIGQLREVG